MCFDFGQFRFRQNEHCLQLINSFALLFLLLLFCVCEERIFPVFAREEGGIMIRVTDCIVFITFNMFNF